MAIKAKISLDNSELKKGLQEAQSQAKKTGSALNKNVARSNAGQALDKLGQNADEAVRALDSVAGAAGKASTGLSGLAGDIIALVKHPIALLIAAIGLLVKIGMTVWDKLTVNIEQYGTKVEGAAKHVDQLIEEHSKVTNRLNQVIEALLQLTSDLDKTNSKWILQKTLVKELQANYGNLGISINETTKEINGLYEGIIKYQRIKRRQNIALYQEKYRQAHQKTMVQQGKADYVLGKTKIARPTNTPITKRWFKISY